MINKNNELPYESEFKESPELVRVWENEVSPSNLTIYRRVRA